ncbi:MAG: inlJ 1 [Flaviaesturariibacter sp.]|nr:inlJ 1 [Flaviaesturariibacter sp.]
MPLFRDTGRYIRTPMAVAPGKDFVFLVGSLTEFVALDREGIAWAWGYETYGNARLKAAFEKRDFPARLFDTLRWTSVSLAYHRFAGIQRDGSLWYLGDDDCRTFGSRTYTEPVRVGVGQDWKRVDLGNVHGVAMTTGGSLFVWGQNLFGQMGNGTPQSYSPSGSCQRFQRLEGESDWTTISAVTTNVAALRADGSLWYWGDTSNASSDWHGWLVPTALRREDRWTAIATAETHTLAIRSDGTLWARGRNSSGEVGDGTTDRRAELVQVGTDRDWAAVAVSNGFSMAAKKDGSVWTWGSNRDYQLGDGTQIDRNVPGKVSIGR